MEHAATLDLAQFEDPEFYDHLERARRQTVGRIGLIAQLLGLAQDTLTLVTLSAALLAFSPWLMLLLVVTILPSFLGETRFAAMEYSLLFRWTPERRQLDYLRYVGASDDTAKEVQLFGLAGWLTERYRVLSERWYRENRKLATRKAIVSSLLSFIGTAGYYSAYIVIIARAVAGAITLGSLTFLAASFGRGRDLIQRLLLGASSIYEQGLYLRDLFLFLEMKPTITSRPGAQPVPRPIRTGFVFEDVGFKYPGGDRWAVRHVSFALRPGERILGHTHEFFGILPPGACEVKARSTWGRNGVAVCFDAGWIDPGYINRLTLEIYNLNQRETVVLPVGERIAQIMFHDTGDVIGAYGEGRDEGFSGKYQSGTNIAALIESWEPPMMLPKAYLDKRATPPAIPRLGYES